MTPWDSIWAQPEVVEAACRDRPTKFPELQGMNAFDAPVKPFYQLQQFECHGTTGAIGPLWIWYMAHITLFRSYLAMPKPVLYMPMWWRFELAEFLYRAAELVDIVIKIPSRRIGVKCQFARMLSRLDLCLRAARSAAGPPVGAAGLQHPRRRAGEAGLARRS